MPIINVARLLLDIALLRRGPEDLPASVGVLGAVSLASIAISMLLHALTPAGEGSVLLQLLFSTAFTLVWYAQLLRMFSKSERFLQTATAIIGFSCISAPVLIPLSSLAVRHQAQPSWQVMLALIIVPILVWVVGTLARILRSALERPLSFCVGLVLLQLAAEVFLSVLLFAPRAAGR